MASVTFIDGKYRALIRRKGHKHISKRFTKEAHAWAWANAIERQMDAGTLKATSAPSGTIAKLIDKYRQMRAKTRPILDTTTEHYTLKQLSRTLGDTEASALTVDDLLGWASARRDEGAGPYTINMDLSKLGTVFRYVGEGLHDVIGAARPKLKYLGLIGGGGLRERRPADDEFVRVLEWLRESKGERYRDFAAFSAMTAMRRGEVARLLWADLDRQKKMVLIRDRKDPRQKKGNDQWVPLLGGSWVLTLRQPQTDERIFPIHPQTMSKYFTEACRALSIPDLHLHDLRHEGISKMFEVGYAIPQVAIVSGHKSWGMLKRYTQINPESLHAHDENQSKLRPLCNPPSDRTPRKS